MRLFRFKRRHPLNLTLAGIEELNHFPTDEARDKAIRDHAQSVMGWSLVLGIVVCGLTAIGSIALARWVVVPFIAGLLPHGLSSGMTELLRFLVVAICMALTITALHRWGVRRGLRHALIEHRVAVCVGCGYLLRGLPPAQRVCPECGREIDESVSAILRGAATPNEAKTPLSF